MKFGILSYLDSSYEFEAVAPRLTIVFTGLLLDAEHGLLSALRQYSLQFKQETERRKFSPTLLKELTRWRSSDNQKPIPSKPTSMNTTDRGLKQIENLGRI